MLVFILDTNHIVVESKMKPILFGVNGIHIIDLQQTVPLPAHRVDFLNGDIAAMVEKFYL